LCLGRIWRHPPARRTTRTTMSLSAIISNRLGATLRSFIQGFRPAPQLCLAGIQVPVSDVENDGDSNELTGGVSGLFDSALWFAVPKKRVSKSRKRMKTTRQFRIKAKENIVFDKRTGEVTLMHKLPKRWKLYIPTMEDFGMQPIDYSAIPSSKSFKEKGMEKKN
jgi:ribosomal protein L32